MGWLLARETVIVLAVLGAVLAVPASVLQRRGSAKESLAKKLNLLGYAAMAVSMALFIIAGFRAVR